MAKPKKDGETQIRMDAETHARMKTLADRVGRSQVKLLRTLSFADQKVYTECEKLRLDAVARSRGES